MARVEIFDPPLCCATGVCGPNVDPELTRIAGDVAWLQRRGVEVKRHNLSQEPEAFVKNVRVLKALNEEDTACLPLVLVDGEIADGKGYPTRERLLELLGMNAE